MAIGKVEQVERRQATVGEVGQQRIGVGEQACLVEALEQAGGQLAGQQRRGSAVRVVVQ